MVNHGTSYTDADGEGGDLSTSELLASLTFGSNAVFSSSNNLPSDNEIAKVTDRTRSEDCSDGKLQGGVTNTASDFDKEKELTDTRNFMGVDFRKLRDEKEAKLNGKKSKNKFLDKLKQEWKETEPGDQEEELGKGKRNRKSRIKQLDGIGSGYGSPTVPVLGINDYDLENGEQSVWRETKKIKIVEKKKEKIPFTNQDFCQVVATAEKSLNILDVQFLSILHAVAYFLLIFSLAHTIVVSHVIRRP